MKTYPIIVGADGTSYSKAAARWAAREAQRRNLPLRVTYVYDWESGETGYELIRDDPDFIPKRAEGIAGTALHEARTRRPVSRSTRTR